MLHVHVLFQGHHFAFFDLIQNINNFPLLNAVECNLKQPGTFIMWVKHKEADLFNMQKVPVGSDLSRRSRISCSLSSSTCWRMAWYSRSFSSNCSSSLHGTHHKYWLMLYLKNLSKSEFQFVKTPVPNSVVCMPVLQLKGFKLCKIMQLCSFMLFPCLTLIKKGILLHSHRFGRLHYAYHGTIDLIAWQ